MLSIQSKLSKTCKQQQMVQKIFRNCKSCWISEMRTTQLKLLEILGAKLNGKKTSKKKFFWKNFGIPREVVPFFRNFGKCCSIRYWKLRKIQNRCFAWMESAPSFYYSYNEPSSYGIRPWTPPSKKIWNCMSVGEWMQPLTSGKNISACQREWLLLSKIPTCTWRFSVS